MDNPPEPPRPGTLVGAATVFYGLMSVVALVIMSLADIDIGARIFGVTSETGEPDATLPLDAALGIGAGLAVVLLTWLLRNVRHLKTLRDTFESVLGPQTSASIAVLAVTSAVGEELLFRGALHPLLGFWPTALLFGALHGGYNPKLFAWALFAILAGILLGWLADFTGNLLAPILAHLTVNYWNLHALAPRAPAAA